MDSHWERLALVLLGLVEALAFWLLKEKSAELRELRKSSDDVRTELATLRAHVGVDGGSGLAARLDTIHDDVQGLRADVQRALQELAEHRGARRRGE